MILKTLRDVEIELYKINNEIRKFLASQSAQAAAGLTAEQVLRIVKANFPASSAVNNEIDSELIGAIVHHRLNHKFYENVMAYDFTALGAVTLNDIVSDPGRVWSITNLGDILRFLLLDTTTSKIFQLEFQADAATPSIFYTGNIGLTLDPVNKIYVRDLDISGTVTGVLGGSAAQANASGTVTLTTTFADVTGATLSLTANGTYIIHGCFCFNQPVNDTECQGQLVHDDSGSFVAVTGIVRSAKDSSATIIATCEKTWVVTIASQPTTVKLQAKKTGGTGTSYTDITNCSIVAHRI